MESGCFFKCGASELKGRLCGFKRYGFCNAQVVGICLAFPFVFDGQKGDEVEALFCESKGVVQGASMGRILVQYSLSHEYSNDTIQSFVW